METDGMLTASEEEAWKRWNIHRAEENEWQEAMNLAWRTFLRYEAGDYSNEGIRNFHDFVNDQRLFYLFQNGKYELYVATSQGKIIGMISKRDEKHISLLFVDSAYHRKGIGRALITYLADRLSQKGIQNMTVNAAPYGIAFYHRVGFQDTGEEVEKEGIRYTPMVYVPVVNQKYRM